MTYRTRPRVREVDERDGHIGQQLDGIIVKRADAVRPGDDHSTIKIKNYGSADCRVWPFLGGISLDVLSPWLRLFGLFTGHEQISPNTYHVFGNRCRFLVYDDLFI